MQPDRQFVELLGGVIAQADYYEVAPETLWYDDDGTLVENSFFQMFRAIQVDSGKPFVAHGVGLSLGTASRDDAPRRQMWLDRVRKDHASFSFEWYTEHLGATALAGQPMTLPIPLPMTGQSARIVRGRLRAMQRVVPKVGVENSVSYFLFGDPLDEPAFLGRIVKTRNTFLVLDLHNVYTMAKNFGFDPQDYIERLDLEKVIEIHVSGGADSDPAWLDGETLRLDSHDNAVPEDVWKLLEDVAPRCPRLKGITLERMEGTVTSKDVPLLRAELLRVRRVVARLT